MTSLIGGGGLQRLHRHRVDGLRAGEVVDVEHVGVGRVLRAGRGPERALHRRAGGGERGEALAVEDLLERDVGGARVGERGRAASSSRPAFGKLLVDQRCRRAKRRSWRPSGRRAAALGEAALEAPDVGLGDVGVALDREQQGDVDVDAVVDRLLDRVEALGRAGILIIRFGRSTRPQYIARFARASRRWCRAPGRVRPPARRSRRRRRSIPDGRSTSQPQRARLRRRCAGRSRAR